MIAYLDSSVLMRIILQEANPLREWDELEHGVSSVLISVEGYRTLDQLWHRNQLDENDLAEKRLLLATFLPRLDLKELTPDVLKLASNALPTPLRTLDALHLATAMLYRTTQPGDERPIFFATHDVQLQRQPKPCTSTSSESPSEPPSHRPQLPQLRRGVARTVLPRLRAEGGVAGGGGA